MFNFLGSLQGLIGLVFGVAALVLSVFGLVDALRHRPGAFTAAGKASKNIWLAVLGVAVALSFYGLSRSTGLDPGRGRRGRLRSGRAPRVASGHGTRVRVEPL